MDQQSGIEKREQPRARLKIEVTYKTADVFTSDLSINISTGGIFIKTPKSPPMGTKLDLEFTLPESQKLIKSDGEIVWIQNPSVSSSLPAGMGIKFKRIAPEDLKEITDYIKKIMASQEPK